MRSPAQATEGAASAALAPVELPSMLAAVLGGWLVVSSYADAGGSGYILRQRFGGVWLAGVVRLGGGAA